MQIIGKHTQGLVLVAVLVTISLLSLLLAGAVADVILIVRSNNAYWQSNMASRACEQLAAHAAMDIEPRIMKQDPAKRKVGTFIRENSRLIDYQRLLNAQPCAMVWAGKQCEVFVAAFFTVNYQLTTPQAGVCEVTIAKLDTRSRCLTPSVTLQPGLQSWRWLPSTTPF